MLATNHGMAGMLLGALLPIPLAIPAALASHYVMDVFPHFGPGKSHKNNFYFRKFVYLDSAIALTFAFITAAAGRWDMFWIGWVAYSPDGYWIYLYFKQKRSMNLKIKNRFALFHARIQHEYKWGMLVELPVAVCLFCGFLYFFN